MKKDLLTLKDFTNQELLDLIDLSMDMKENPEKYAETLKGKTLMMIFQKPSLRTRISFETGMTKLGGHAIYYDTSTSPMGKGETIHDTAKCSSRYVDIISARLFAHSDIEDLAKNSDVPVINMLTDFSHPCQIVADLMSIKEHKGTLKGLTLVFLGDGNNNVTHSLLYGCVKVGMNVKVASPQGYQPQTQVVEECNEMGKETGSEVLVTDDPEAVLAGADVVVTDTWMSYHIPDAEKEERVKVFGKYQVDSEKMAKAKSDAIFMHCLPALRGYEMTADVIDGPQSIVFDEAENRMWTEMAIMVKLMGK